MYPQPGNDPKFLFDSKGRVLALSLGADATTEHELGIGSIMAAFGVQPLDFYNRSLDHLTGIDRRIVRTIPNEFTLESLRNRAVLRFNTNVDPPARVFLAPESSLWSAWTSDCFVVAGSYRFAHNLRVIHGAMMRCDAMFFTPPSLGGGIIGSGLTITIPSRLSLSDKRTLKSEDVAKIQLYSRADAVLRPIKAVLEKSGLRWFSLSEPRIIKNELRFWLNPQEQHLYEAGWFNVEELLLWSVGSGPIVKVKK